MGKTLWAFAGFVAGGVAGFAASRQYFLDKYRQIADEEIDSVKSAFLKTKPQLLGKTGEPVKPEGVAKYTNYQKVLGYKTGTEELKPGEKPAILETGPRVIEPEQFGEHDDYEKISLTLYSDGTLADDDDRKMTTDEIENSVGADSLTHFGEYEDDSVYVRNEERKCDYEILLDSRNYSDEQKKNL